MKSLLLRWNAFPRCSPRRWLALVALVVGFALLVTPALAQPSPVVYVMTFDGPVNPVLLSYLERGINLAETEGAAALVLRLDTPGGQVDLTQRVVKMIRASRVPVIVYVWPTGANAGSAGTFITLAGHAAAMAPGSSIGAASPVAATGEELGETMTRKVTNILAADIENLAQRRGERAVEWARKAVEEAAAATADEALAMGVVDAVAVDVNDLLAKLDGLEVEVAGQEQTLKLAGAEVRELPLTAAERFFNTLINAIAIPGIAILLIVLGVQAIISEFSQPGGYVAGIAGGIAVLLGLYALGILNANWAGLGFIALSFVLFLADIKAPTHGLLTLGGIVTFIFGSVMLFQGTEVPIPWGTIIGLAIFSAIFFSFVIAKVLQAQRRRPSSGQEALVGARAVARTELNPSGKVVAQGEWWDAELEGDPGPVPPGTELTVVRRDGFKLRVRRA
ncbi:MAG: nodulation protein NfeD [Anaerolineae bacterium]|nr:nodulation protein NfeD [Anaerolineae bacterium]